MSIKRLIAGLAGAPLLAGLAMPALVFAADTTEVTSVTPNGWSFVDDQHDSLATATGKYVNGPGTPPAGNGSAELKTTSGNDGQALIYFNGSESANEDYSGTKIADLTNLSYSTYGDSANTEGPQLPALQFDIDVDGAGGNTGWQGRMVFEPYMNTEQQSPQLGEWQSWDALNNGDAKWWFTKTAFTDGLCGQASPCTLNEIETHFPDASITSRIVFKAGSGWSGTHSTNVDKFTIDDTTYNFEVFQPTGEITSPAENEHVRGTVTLSATYTDGDPDVDAVQWALRSSCNDNTTTKAGNVDGYNTPSTWDGANFSATVDTSTFDPGSYCFVFNPTDDAGQNNVRLTRTFVVDANAPYNKDECKNDGWQSFTAPTFKNQGDCVSFIASNGKAKGNPTPAVHVMANNPKF
jgi:hypothetical protein